MTIFSLLLRLIPIFTTLFLGAFILYKNHTSRTNQLFFITSTALGLWPLFILIQELFWAQLGHNALYILGVLMGEIHLISALYSYMYYPEPRIKMPKIIAYPLWMAGLYFFYTIITEQIFVPVPLPIHRAIFIATPHAQAYTIFVVAILLCICGVLIKKWTLATHSSAKRQLQYICSGYAIAFPLVLFFNLLPSNGYQNDLKTSIGYSSILAISVGLYLAITKTKAFDIKTVLHQTLFWGALSIALAALPYLFLKHTSALSILDAASSKTLLSTLVLCVHFIPAFILISLGTFVLYKNWRNRINQLFFSSTWSMGLWSLFILIQNTFSQQLGDNYLYNAGMAMGAITCGCFVTLFLRYPGKHYKLPTLFYLLLTGLTIFFITQALMGKMYMPILAPITDHTFIESPIGTFYLRYCIFMLVSMLAIIVSKLIGEHNPKIKSQIYYILIGFSATAVLIILFNLLPNATTQSSISNCLGYASVIFLAIGVYAAIAKAQAFEIKTVFHQTIFWGIISIFITTSIYSILMYSLNPSTSNLFRSFLDMVIFYGAFRIYLRFIQPKIDHLFFRKKHLFAKKLLEFSHDISELQSLETLTQTIFKTIDQTLYAKTATFFLKKQDQIEEYSPGQQAIAHPKNTLLPRIDPSCLSVTIGTTHHPIGLLILSEKKSLKPYTESEKKFLTNLGEKIALHIENNMLFDTLQKQKEALTTSQSERLKNEKETIQNSEKENYIRDLSHLVSHEVKNTVYAIETTLDVLEKTQFSSQEEQQEILGLIYAQCQRLNNFSQKYLLHEKLSLSFTQISVAPFSPKKIINTIINKYSGLISKKNIEMNVLIPETFLIHSDQEKFQILLENSIQNALYYTYENTQITITLNETDDEFALHIQDEGPGLATPNTSTPLSTGFGIPICYKIAALLQLSLDIRSDHGTKFSIISRKGRLK